MTLPVALRSRLKGIAGIYNLGRARLTKCLLQSPCRLEVWPTEGVMTSSTSEMPKALLANACTIIGKQERDLLEPETHRRCQWRGQLPSNR